MENEENLNIEQDELKLEENSLSNEIEDLKTELKEASEQLFRVHTEMDNQRKRMERETEVAKKYALQDFVTRLLPAKDSMEKGLDISYMENGIDGEVLFEGMTSTLRICDDAFKSVGVELINPLGKDFNPELHEAMAIKQVDDVKPNVVLSVYQKGYLLNGRLIRPARVEVSAAYANDQ